MVIVLSAPALLKTDLQHRPSSDNLEQSFLCHHPVTILLLPSSVHAAAAPLSQIIFGALPFPTEESGSSDSVTSDRASPVQEDLFVSSEFGIDWIREMALGAGWTPHTGGGGSGVAWDDLRKQARRLETDLDVKLASFRRGQIDPAVGSQRDSNEAEIERLLQHLNDVNVKMQNWVSSAGSDVLSHTLARHQNILHELSQEFARIRSSTKAIREHAELLQYFGGTDESKSFMDDRGSGVQSLLREQATINRSTAQIDSVIGHAQEAYTALRYQRTTFGDITSKIGTLGTRIPSVNKVLTAIRRRKSRDTLIVGAVTSLCFILLLLYWLAK